MLDWTEKTKERFDSAIVFLLSSRAEKKLWEKRQNKWSISQYNQRKVSMFYYKAMMCSKCSLTN